MPIEEEDLVREIVQRRSMILAYARSIVVSSELAEDVFQDVVVIALKKRGQLESLNGIGAWLRKIARFESMNALRKLHKQPVLFDDHVLDLVDASWKQMDENKSRDYSAAVCHCLALLSPKMQHVIELRYKQGFSGKELADELGRPLNTVYVTLSRIHTNLRECINRYLRRQYHNG